jgi:hypothetical protein
MKEQKENHLSVSSELLECTEANINSLKNIITGDETWVYG